MYFSVVMLTLMTLHTNSETDSKYGWRGTYFLNFVRLLAAMACL